MARGPHDNPPDPRTLLVVAGALGTAGLVTYALTRPPKTAQLPSGTNPTGTGARTPPPVVFPDPGPQPVSAANPPPKYNDVAMTRNGVINSDPAVNKLNSLALAYRAAVYSMGLTQWARFYTPLDAFYAALTDPAERNLNLALGLKPPPGGEDALGPQNPRGLDEALRALAVYYDTVRPAMRPVPWGWPKDVVDAINAQLAASYPRVPRLYMHPA